MMALLSNRRVFGGRRLLGVCAGLTLTFAAQATGLQIERVDLGDSAPGVQAYNLQEAREWRVFARSEAGFKRSRIFVQRPRSRRGWTSGALGVGRTLAAHRCTLA